MNEPPQQIKLTFTARNPIQAREIEAAWREIVAGRKLDRTEALEHDLEQIQERARPALRIIETAIREHPGTGQARRLVQFLAAIYNGYDYAFDLTELRVLDTELANACLDYLNYDRLAKAEVHRHLSGGDRELWQWIRYHRVPPRLSLNDEQAEAFADLVAQSDRTPDELLREAMADLLEKYARKASHTKG